MPETLGKTLKRIRESRHLSIEEVSERSRIPKHIVSTLEEDRLNEIKSVFYAKSFVKTYAVFLGALDEPGIKEYLAKPAHPPEKILKPAAKPVYGTAQQKFLPVNPDFAIAKSARRADRLNPIGFNLARRGNPKQISNPKGRV